MKTMTLRQASCFLAMCFLITLIACSDSATAPDRFLSRPPRISPDYAVVTFPVNIAPPNFLIDEKAERYRTEIGMEGQEPVIRISGRSPKVKIPQKDWHTLLTKAAGKRIYIRITLYDGQNWIGLTDILDSISIYPIDRYLAYRLLYPGYELWNEMGIYQRDLTSYTETPVLENRRFGKQCVNCHTFLHNSPDTMMLHVRGAHGGTVVCRDGKTTRLRIDNTVARHGATYPAWHPSGRFLALSSNEIQQFFHRSGQKPIEVADMESDLTICEIGTGRMFTDTLVCGDDYMETFPTWNPDGTQLYFCRAEAWHKGMPLDSVRYDLYRVAFDVDSCRLHSLECIYQASAQGKSVSFPRVSPDGRYVMCSRSDYGNFSIWHPEADLILVDLRTGEVNPMTETNSDDVESFHTWSSSGRWFVFSSKRMDGLWARPYFAAFDPSTGRTTKPFVLPQEEPDFYDNFMYTYNLPELILKPIRSGEALLQEIL